MSTAPNSTIDIVLGKLVQFLERATEMSSGNVQRTQQVDSLMAKAQAKVQSAQANLVKIAQETNVKRASVFGELQTAQSILGQFPARIQLARQRVHKARANLNYARLQGKPAKAERIALRQQILNRNRTVEQQAIQQKRVQKIQHRLSQVPKPFHAAVAKEREAVKELTEVKDTAKQITPAKKLTQAMGDWSKHLETAGLHKLSDAFDTAGLAGRASAGDPTAIAGLIQKGIEDAKKRVQAAVDAPMELGRALFQSKRIGEFGVHLSRSVGNMGKVVGGPLGDTVEVMGKLGEVTLGAVDNLRDWAKTLSDANSQFARFSGAMAQVEARQQIRQMFLSRERGERRAGSAENLNEAWMQLEKALTPWEDALANFQAGIVTDIAQALTAIAQSVDGLTSWFSTQSKPPPNDAAFWLNQAKAPAINDFGTPDRFLP